nr:hypothetical protein [uncultured Mediterranean phage uvMED]
MFEIFASGHHPQMNTGMTSADIINLVQTLGAPMIFAGLAFWFIRYQYDQNAKERTAYIERDEANDKRAFALAERSNEAMNKLSTAVDSNTKAVVEMVNLLRNSNK